MEFIVRECPHNGMFGGPFEKAFTVHTGLQQGWAEISVEQMGERVIRVHTIENNSIYDPHHLYFDLKRLLMILDGQFYSVKSVTEGGSDITTSIQKKLLANYYSADFMIGGHNRLIDFSKVLSETLFDDWRGIQKELDIVHNMVLYSLSGTKMPIDMKCAFLTEAFIGVGELVQNRKKGVVLPKIKKGDSQLAIYLEYLISHYGQEIFQDECQTNLKRFAEILKDSRNRIAHIKSKQGKQFLNGEESVLYLCKLSLMYRFILLDLLNIPQNLYQKRLSECIETIKCRWADVLNSFLCKL